MILKRCSRGCEPQQEALCWTVAAWNRTDGVRVAYKAMLCLACIASQIAPLHVASEMPTMTCPACGIDTSDDCDPVYVTWIPRGVGTLKSDHAFCAPCAARFRVWIQEGAVLLEDRSPSSGGQEYAPRYDASQMLARLGVRLPDNA